MNIGNRTEDISDGKGRGDGNRRGWEGEERREIGGRGEE
jgi:hypothetical protein